MELTVKVQCFENIPKHTDMLITLNSGKEMHHIRKSIPDGLLKDKELFRRIFDEMFYEMKTMLNKHYGFTNEL